MTTIQHRLIAFCFVTTGSYAASTEAPIQEHTALGQVDMADVTSIDVRNGIIDQTPKRSPAASHSASPIRKRTALGQIASDGEVNLSNGFISSPIRKRTPAGKVAADGSVDMFNEQVDSTPELSASAERKASEMEGGSSTIEERDLSSNSFSQQDLKMASGIARQNESSADDGNQEGCVWKTNTMTPKLKVATLTSSMWPADYCIDFDMTFPSSINCDKYGNVGAVALLGQFAIYVTCTIKLFEGNAQNGPLGFVAFEQSNGYGPYFATEGLGGPSSAHEMTFCYRESTANEAPVWLRYKKPVKAGYIYNPKARYPTTRNVPLTLLSGYHDRVFDFLDGGSVEFDKLCIRPYPFSCMQAVSGAATGVVASCSEKGKPLEGTCGTMCLKTKHPQYGITQGCDNGVCSRIVERNTCCTDEESGEEVICVDKSIMTGSPTTTEFANCKQKCKNTVKKSEIPCMPPI